MERPSPSYHSTINLPQLPLPVFSGDPKLWREFWNSFNAAIHLQEIPNIQKLTYLISCLKGEALEAIRGFDIAPENYDLIRQVLIDKYGNPITIKKSLYNEFYSIQRNDKEWKTKVEAMEKILQVNRNQKTPLEPILKRALQFQRERGTSALFITKQSNEVKNLQSSSKIKFNKERRPCIFCNKNHWDNECPNCLTAKQRFERLKELKACTNCFRTKHATSDCKQKRRICFHCKGQHNTALCYKKYCSLNNGSSKEETNSTIITNLLNQPINHQGKKVLLICKEIEAVNPSKLDIREDALVLFDPGSQSSFISRKLASRLGLAETTKEELKLFSFGNQFPKLYQTNKVKLGIRTLESKIITINAYALDYLTDKLQIINPSSYDMKFITRQKQLDESEGYWSRPDIIIGVDHFFEFMQPYKVHSCGYTNMTCELDSLNSINVTTVITNPDIDQFWKLEVIGINEQPNDQDDEEALKQFKNSITKENNRYQVCWPWKDKKINLQDNYGLCYGRLKTLVKRLQSNQSLLEHSRCALQWIKNRSRLLSKFIQNRIDEIRMANFSYRYVPSRSNPADIATKGYMSPIQLAKFEQWWTGPQWLRDEESTWPQWEDNIYYEQEEYEHKISWALRFIRYISKRRFEWLKEVPIGTGLTSYELADATKALIIQAQSEGINEEEINKWNLYYSDTHSLWKCRSRLDNISVGLYPDSLNLIYLPRHNPVTKLLIQHQHEDLCHAGIAHTLSELRRNFW
uniref:DUF1758 domain-containing protein n=1 Tax=Wuchereria bancrofti TaxID=6293 RepID=A0AAF5Q6X3_WUCBA